ncbi:DUF7284 family protein [Haloarcula halophila]|uniref:DUF7284 family protein n=1 Tax=Haloarcula halophila TaxID=3032584 RepID=UPI0023E456FC|nr:hypothetical protein [Halomicroarcula sp. DFY41]
MSRAVSTAVDATVFLLFVGAAVAVVLSGTAAEQPRTGNLAAEDAELLATSTATVEYSLSTRGLGTDHSAPTWVANGTARRQRSAHGTVAELLGDGAMRSAAVNGQSLSRSGIGFKRTLSATTQRRLQERRRLTAVRVRWRPYRDAPIGGTYHVGEQPPRDASVRAGSVTVPSGMDNVTAAALRAARSSGYDGVATVVARAVVDGLFPPERTRLALHGDYPADVLTAARYHRTANATGAAPLALGQSNVTTLNRKLTGALAELLEADMRTQFRSPTAAARATETHRVRVTVRTWSP